MKALWVSDITYDVAWTSFVSVALVTPSRRIVG